MSLLRTARLDLPLLSEPFLAASLDGHWRRATALLGVAVPGEWWAAREIAAMRLEDLRADPAYRPWALRAIVDRHAAAMVGFCGFHSRPGPAYLAPWAPDAVEFGYSVFSAARNRGVATEASQGLMHWAAGRPGVRHFVLAIDPGNAPSLAVARKLGFTRRGVHQDPAGGSEEIYVAAAERPGVGQLFRNLAAAARGR